MPKELQEAINKAKEALLERQAKGLTQVFHMGPEGIKELDPEMQGSGADARKFMRTGKPQTPVAHAYIHGSEPEEIVLASVRGPVKKHKLDVDMSKLYDIGADPHQHLARAQHDMAHGLIGPAEGNPVDAMDLAKTRIKAAGHQGILRPTGVDKAGSVELFHKTPLYAKGGKVKWDTGGQGAFPGMEAQDPGAFTSEDTHPHIEHDAKQKKLIAGVNPMKVKSTGEGATGDYTISGVGTNSAGKRTMVKGHFDPDIVERWGLGDEYNDLSTAQREALYYNTAKHMGMEKFVPPTAVTKNTGGTETGTVPNRHFSVMQMIPKAEQYERHNLEHKKHLDEAENSGDLHKLAIMNTLLGNSDRHNGNWMVSPKGIHMIDHGLTFNTSRNYRRVYSPGYLDAADVNQAEPLHPHAAEWLKNLDVHELNQHFNRNRTPDHIKDPIVSGLQEAQRMVHSNKNANLYDVRRAILSQFNTKNDL